MAWLEKRGATFRIKFRYAGQNLSKALKTGDAKEAEGALARVEENLRLLERGRLEVPPGAVLSAFLLSDGKIAGTPCSQQAVTLQRLCADFVATLPRDALEENSLYTIRVHIRHLQRIIGKRFKTQNVTLPVLQKYVDARSREKGLLGRRLSPVTIKKELTTLGSIWTWALPRGFVPGPFPSHGLRFPKATQKPAFQTWEEIERHIAGGGLSEFEQKELWDCLFLTRPQIAELLEYVRKHAAYPFVYPMMAFVAHTGARRSEICRALRSDFDFEAQSVQIREKKRVRGTRTNRRVPLTPFLTGVMREWIARHPGGQYVICQALHVPRANKTRAEYGPLTRNEANHHFKATLANSKWSVIRGWHCLRHSFCSNCAAAGIDQRIINGWTGHQSEEMARRYRHLFPDQQRQAIELVFGPG